MPLQEMVPVVQGANELWKKESSARGSMVHPECQQGMTRERGLMVVQVYIVISSLKLVMGKNSKA